MKTILLLTLLALVSGKPTGDEEISLIAEPVPDLTSGSAPAYWSAECGGRTYVGSYTLMMDWAQCKDYCAYFPHAPELGHIYSFVDILEFVFAKKILKYCYTFAYISMRNTKIVFMMRLLLITIYLITDIVYIYICIFMTFMFRFHDNFIRIEI